MDRARGDRRRRGATAAWVFRRPLNRTLARWFRRFNVGFDHATNVYTRSVGRLLRVSSLVLVVYGGLLPLTWWGFTRSPSGFIPAQDKGYLLVNVQLPDAASVERTERVMHRIEELAHKTPGVKDTVAIAGQSILLGANAPNFGAMYVMLDDFHQRTRPRPFRREDRCPVAGRFPAGDQGRAGERAGRPADRRPGHCRGLQDHHRGPRRQPACRRCSRWARRSSTAAVLIVLFPQGLR